jgi:hypothetical protein
MIPPPVEALPLVLVGVPEPEVESPAEVVVLCVVPAPDPPEAVVPCAPVLEVEALVLVQPAAGAMDARMSAPASLRRVFFIR